MKRVLDTTVLVDILRGDPAVSERFRNADPSQLLVTSVSVAELTTGAACAGDSQRETFHVDLLLRGLRQVPLDERSAKRAGLIKAMLGFAGATIGVADRFIAACALEHDAIVVTSNTREFNRVPGLVTEDWRVA